MKKIGVLIGSLRKGSYSRATAEAIVKMFGGNYTAEILETGDLPLYNPDLDEGKVPSAWQRFREQAAQCDAYLFVTPEYNRSVPANLKNVLDVGSRPYGQSVWGGKAGAVISLSPGAMGGFGANHHLRQPMVFLDVLMMQQPEVYLGKVDTLFDEKGKLTDKKTEEYLKNFADAFCRWIDKVSK